jgi:hypothetical protein
MPIVIYLYVDAMPKRERPKACERLPAINGRVDVIDADTGMLLSLPAFANIDRYRERGCENAQSFSISYLWYENQLIPAYRYDERVKQGLHEKGHHLSVRIYFKGAWTGGRDLITRGREAWRYQPAIPHVKYPLEFYPRYYWDDPDNPSKKSLRRASLDQVWGIRNTKYRHVGTGRAFNAFCSIPPLDPTEPDSRVKAEFAHYGDSKCRGGVSADKNGNGFYFMVDVWAYHNPRFQAIKDINLIYDALVEEIQTFIKE